MTIRIQVSSYWLISFPNLTHLFSSKHFHSGSHHIISIPVLIYYSPLIQDPFFIFRPLLFFQISYHLRNLIHSPPDLILSTLVNSSSSLIKHFHFRIITYKSIQIRSRPFYCNLFRVDQPSNFISKSSPIGYSPFLFSLLDSTIVFSIPCLVKIKSFPFHIGYPQVQSFSTPLYSRLVHSVSMVIYFPCALLSRSSHIYAAPILSCSYKLISRPLHFTPDAIF